MITNDFKGLVVDLDNDAYHASPHFSSSNIKEMKKSPAHFKINAINKTGSKSTHAKELGSALHRAVLEGKHDKYILMPSFKTAKGEISKTPKSTSEYKEWAAAQEGKLIVDSEEYQMILDMVKVIHDNDEAQELLQGALCEASFFAQDPDTKLMIKCRPDALIERNDGRKIIVDYKTTVSASKSAFQRSIVDYGYHLSAIHYINVLSEYFGQGPECFDFLWIAQEKTAPYFSALYYMSDSMRTAACKEYMFLMNQVATCLEVDSWPSYQDSSQRIDLPSWYSRVEESEEI